MITICGRMGTLNEFTIAFEDRKPQGVLIGTEGTADYLKNIIEKMHRGPGESGVSQRAQKAYRGSDRAYQQGPENENRAVKAEEFVII